ncbi:phosphatidylcholine:diacylglycerol cholinephosphotransferase 1-like [Canna indica]|uniref:Phosphatidylcholine:diacylglycerol cholinephosphotransferase 1-like n=1 Tax=Canna indica TaxID=4628 RepID=A0AAQ3KIE6_9LILI|nr:phosphatidylcholine:diacylglycerol cholinephosphotransferase 1-like [Canna indica]
MATKTGGATTHIRVQRKAAALDTATTATVTLGVANHAETNHLGRLHAPPKSGERTKPSSPAPLVPPQGPSFADWSLGGAAEAARRHPLPCAFLLALLFFMGVEYTIPMVASTAPPLDFGFIVTKPLNKALAASSALNTVLAVLNTVFVAMQTTYILWTFAVEGRPRPTIATLFMFTCRGILGCSTQLPLPQDFVGSGADFPVGNVSFFLFFSGHVAGAVIASLDMRRMSRYKMAWGFDVLNLLQCVRLLASRGHYTIDLAVGVGAGFVFDVLAGNYVEATSKCTGDHPRACCSCSSR